MEALLGAFDDSDWQRKLPQLADRLAEMGPSHSARLKVCSFTFCPRAAPAHLMWQLSSAAVQGR